MDLHKVYQLARDKTVLLVEDDVALMQQMKELLEEMSVRVDTAADGQEGFQAYERRHEQHADYYDLVIADIRMPKMDGIQLTHLIYDRNPDQMVIIISAHTDTEYLIRLINMGILRFITKPVEYEQLVETLHQAFYDISLRTAPAEHLASFLVSLGEDYSWDLQRQELLVGHTSVRLSKKERTLLALMFSRPDKVYTPDDIILAVWGNEADSTTDASNVKYLINRIRKKLPEGVIENIYGCGYRVVLSR